MAGPVKDREAFQRLSFLYQAAHCVLAQDPMNQALARFYCYTERTIAKRLVLRRDPSVKRTLCRGCSSLLIPGLTCTQRQRRCRGQRWTVQTCLTCQRSQRFLNDPDHLLWGDRPEAQLGSQAVIYTEHGTRTYNPKIKSHMLLRLSRPEITSRKRGRQREREEEAGSPWSRELDVRLDPRTVGSRLEPKAEDLNH
ncbi:ribonuclease P protein subunit p21 isoform X2 [Mustela nigripes]|uniref:ribonuclease P protein subunit p21 isoform X2 n=1 Tax=Mustela lutreola TaxID=9666 RepID=UPI002797C510|nr:ribonuclease P protein subunit p21 isoform X2 [Mustela lutreola]XP_059255709.1 ribonuclease P protein subunit p21 isoform X2 [Mustela nigripes]